LVGKYKEMEMLGQSSCWLKDSAGMDLKGRRRELEGRMRSEFIAVVIAKVTVLWTGFIWVMTGTRWGIDVNIIVIH
jgi:hypothetical protein